MTKKWMENIESDLLAQHPLFGFMFAWSVEFETLYHQGPADFIHRNEAGFVDRLGQPARVDGLYASYGIFGSDRNNRPIQLRFRWFPNYKCWVADSHFYDQNGQETAVEQDLISVCGYSPRTPNVAFFVAYWANFLANL